jgi:hypothetical protein
MTSTFFFFLGAFAAFMSPRAHKGKTRAAIQASYGVGQAASVSMVTKVTAFCEGDLCEL